MIRRQRKSLAPALRFNTDQGRCTFTLLQRALTPVLMHQSFSQADSVYMGSSAQTPHQDSGQNTGVGFISLQCMKGENYDMKVKLCPTLSCVWLQRLKPSITWDFVGWGRQESVAIVVLRWSCAIFRRCSATVTWLSQRASSQLCVWSMLLLTPVLPMVCFFQSLQLPPSPSVFSLCFTPMCISSHNHTRIRFNSCQLPYKPVSLLKCGH